MQRWLLVHSFQAALQTAIILFILFFGLPRPASSQEIAPASPGAAEAFISILQDLEGLTIDPNSATAERLQSLPWITLEIARQIKTYQIERGDFHHLQDLLNVPGFSPEVFEASLPYLSLQEPLQVAGQTRWRLTRPPGKSDGLAMLRAYHRSEVHISDHLSAVVLTERDPGDPGEAGFADFWSAYVIATQIPFAKRYC